MGLGATLPNHIPACRWVGGCDGVCRFIFNSNRAKVYVEVALCWSCGNFLQNSNHTNTIVVP